MKYFNKRKIVVMSMLSISLLILTAFVLCNPSYSEYKKRIKVNTINVEIQSYQPLNLESDEPKTVDVE